MTKDYYETLGVSRSATPDELKKAYRQLALKFHPDRNAGDKESEERFKEINEAYSCLSDPAKRSSYDRFGTADGFSGGGPGFGSFSGGFSDIFGDIFEDILGGFGVGGGTQRSNRPRRGSDLRYDIELNLMEAAFGVEKDITVPRHEPCDKCSGTGSAGGKAPERCSACKGSGQTMFQQGFFSVSKTCSRCGGAGAVITDPCKECSGAGRVRKTRSLNVKIPPGVDSGMKLKLSGEGEAGTKGAPHGDLYVYLSVHEHPFFKRHERDLYCEVPIAFYVAVFGGEIEVPKLKGSGKIKIPSGTQSGEVFRLRGEGIQRVNGGHKGDLIVKVYIDVPKKVTPKQRELLEEYAKESGDEVQRSFAEKVKGFFTN
ncbi:molecular chaperone DnaJ [Candidatus Magnetomonas plexicatena]|uniref:molecular chaperone DnaJ n=1 Tax=Candidatus Magnetomonas plexicatena TaxID=2552947 RepID=UPI001C74015D|nr:molecular chaperone DnaJ [Nitrospirales bacterium LBB_01]